MEQKDIRGRWILITVVTALLVWAYFANGIRLGQDLKGGTTLRFSLDIERAKKAGRIKADADPELIVIETLKVIDKRINKYGLAETNLTAIGDRKFEISLPAGAEGEAEGIVDVVTQLGKLELRIEVLPDSQYLARRQAAGEDPPERKNVWRGTDEEFQTFKTKEIALWKAARDRGELPNYQAQLPDRYRLVKKVGSAGDSASDFHVMEVPKSDRTRFDGQIIDNPRAAVNPSTTKPVVLYDVRQEYQNIFGEWTGANVGLPMAIVLNEEYYSAPTILEQLTDNVQISLGEGSRESLQKEAETIATVLQTGSLKIKPKLEAKARIGATLAGASRDRGITAIIVAFALVLVFMLLYYRGSGVVANIALLLNLVMLVGFMAFFQAVLTLPGIAGIVLTVGMAVDANILINERIREEIRAGRTLRRAISEGYDRALSAIIDANVTSLITAVFLYNFGSGPVRGFAVTLALGLLVSMFTSLYVTRTIFEWLLKTGRLKGLSIWGTGEPPRFNWLGLRRIFAPLSVAGVIFGIVEFTATDKYTLYDVDFTGGYRIQTEFNTPTTVDNVKTALRDRRKVQITKTAFDDKGELTRQRVELEVGPYPNATVLAVGTENRSTEIKVQRLFEQLPEGLEEEDQGSAFQAYVRAVLSDRLLPNWLLSGPERYAHPSEGGEEALSGFNEGWNLRVAFVDPDGLVTPERLRKLMKETFPIWVEEEGRQTPKLPAEIGVTRQVEVRPVAQAPAGTNALEIWMVSDREKSLSPKDLRQRMGEFLGGDKFRLLVAEELPVAQRPLAERLSLSDPFPEEDQIGSSVAERLKNDAMVALFLSLVGIIVYIGVRFHSRAMGFAAVICLFHDVAITLGIVAVANQIGLVDAKINLPMVAAFLTLVGYSVNDTVVVFDRIRENRGKRPDIPPELINLSINQTLARTIKTSITFLLVCLALFFFNLGQRNVLEGFSFILIIGSFVGTYSTIAISAPLLLYLPWLWKRLGKFAPDSRIVTVPAQNPALLLLTPVAAVLWALWWVAFTVMAFVVGLVMFIPWALGDDATVKDPKDPYAPRAAAASS